jgi:GntR family transcriptional regulator, transcriptional repressor for pyruvate dehydrogenase complex
MGFQPTKPTRVSEQIADQLRSSILAGEFSPGEKLPPERELAELFGVSRPSVRQAINMLATSGMVISSQGVGTIVLSIVAPSSETHLSELLRVEQEMALKILEVRKGVEGWTVFYAAKRALPEDLSRLQLVINAMEKNFGSGINSLDYDVNFHILIARAAHNVAWLQLMQTLFDSMRKFQQSVWRSIYFPKEDYHIPYEFHRLIFEAIRRKDGESAQRLMLEHLNVAQERCMAYLSQTPQ